MKCCMNECYHFQWFIFHSWMISMIIIVFVSTFVIWGSLSLKKRSYLGCQILTLALQRHLLTFLHFGSLPTVLFLLPLKLIINWKLTSYHVHLERFLDLFLIAKFKVDYIITNLVIQLLQDQVQILQCMNENRMNTCLK